MQPQEKAVIESAIAVLKGQCDGAQQIDDVGFSKFDAPFFAYEYTGEGASLLLAAKRLIKYHRQLPDAINLALREIVRLYVPAADGPFLLTPSSEPDTWIVHCAFTRKDEAKEKARLALRFDRAAIYWRPATREWITSSDRVRAMLASGDFAVKPGTVLPPATAAVMAKSAPEAVARTKDLAFLVAQEKASGIDWEARFNATTFSRPPMPHQIPAIKDLCAEVDQGAICGDDMGLGKTFIALGVSEVRKQRMLVICPASARTVWLEEMFISHPTFTAHVIGETVSKQARIAYGADALRIVHDPTNADVVIVSYEGAYKLCIPNPDPNTSKYHTMKMVVDPMHAGWLKGRLAIADECHFGKNSQARRTQGLLALFRSCGPKLALSGTLIPNRPQELWTVLCATGRNRDVAPTKAHYWSAFVDGANHRALHAKLTQGKWYVRRTKADVLKNLPPKTRKELVLDTTGTVSPEIQRALEQLRNAANQSETLAALTNMQTAANAMKVQPMTEILRLRYLANEKTVVQSTRTEPLKEIHERLTALGIASELLIGGINDFHRSRIQREFQRGHLKVVLTTIDTAITLHAADTLYLLDLDWSPAKVQQREDRIYRIGQTRPVTIIRMIAANIDRYKVEMCSTKQEVISACLDGKESDFMKDDASTQVEIMSYVTRRLLESA